jgi:hypothetical protein
MGLLSFLMSAGLIVCLCLVFEPRWETNDDVGMSMVAHGYGLATYGSPNLLFSNAVWGYLVRAIPTINGVLGYSLGTMVAVVVAAWGISYFLLRLGAGYLIAFLAVVLLLARPTLFPQFTVNAGLLAVAAVIGWRVHACDGDIGSLIFACALAFLGFLVRVDECFLVIAIGVLFLPWRALLERRRSQIGLLLLGAAIVSAAVLDRGSYRDQEWQRFVELDAARAPFTDFGAGDHLKQRPDITARYGYSANDLDLVSHWFFVDPKIANPTSLKAMLVELGPLPTQPGNIGKGFVAIKALPTKVLLPLFLTGALLFLVYLKWPVAMAWALFLAAVFTMGILGRPGILRVYVPVLSLLLLAPLFMSHCFGTIRQWIVVLALLTACAANFYLLIPEQARSKAIISELQAEIKRLPEGPFVAWGRGFPYEFVYPVLSSIADLPHLQIYSLGVETLAPYSLAVAEEHAGGGMVDRLQTAEGVRMIALPVRIELLDIFCRERFGKTLHMMRSYRTTSVTVQQVRCEEQELTSIRK